MCGTAQKDVNLQTICHSELNIALSNHQPKDPQTYSPTAQRGGDNAYSYVA